MTNSTGILGVFKGFLITNRRLFMTSVAFFRTRI